MRVEEIRKEVWFTAVRSRGPGGQNVNRVSSAAQLGWDYQSSLGLNAEEKALVQAKLFHFINRRGEFFLRSDVSRDLEQNKALCLEKLERLLLKALHRPKKRKATKPTYSSKQKRLESKSQHSKTKSMRKKVSWSGD